MFGMFFIVYIVLIIMRNVIGYALLIVSLILLSWRISLTGNIISDYLQKSSLSFHLIGLVLLFVSLLILTSKRDLDYLVLPGGESKWKNPRLKAALEAKKKRKIRKMYWMEGVDSEEDILLLGEKVKSGDRVGIDTFPMHYREYMAIAKKGEKYGKFPKGVKFENIRIDENASAKLYGILGWIEEKIKRRPLAYKKDRNEKYLEKIKGFVHKIIG